jgi:hypothetical protein
MDKITKSLINELLVSQDIASEGDSKDFEKLSIYSIISNEYNKTFELESLKVGDGGDTGIDGLAIIVNGQLIETTDEIDDLLEINNSLEVTYIFIQAKTSANFDSGSINTFIFGVNDFFSDDHKLVRNNDIQRLAEISDYIYLKAPKFKENPTLKMYYVTTGKWLDDRNLLAVINDGTANLESKNLFEKVIFYPFGARELSNAYRKTKESISTTIIFSNRVTLPPINGITQAFIGLLPFKEFEKIISNDEGNLLNVFEENVRDFQGENNEVNGGISGTLNHEDSDIFSVLNNGVTIVASSISPTGDKFTLTDYQIVNGCQTSNVLYNNKESKYIDKVQVPVKIIATTDDEVKTRITLATNNQTPIKKEQLAALTAFQRNLELYYNTYSGEEKLFYERRAKQFNKDNSILKTKIITVPYQIKSFAAMFLNEPHNVTSFFGYIVKRLNDGKVQIFSNDHSFAPYYTSAFAYFKLESHFKKKAIDISYKKVKFHILMLFRVLFEIETMPALSNAKKMETYCDHLLKILRDDDKSLKAFKRCIEVIEMADFEKTDKQDVKLVLKTRNLLDYAKNNE